MFHLTNWQVLLMELNPVCRQYQIFTQRPLNNFVNGVLKHICTAKQNESCKAKEEEKSCYIN